MSRHEERETVFTLLFEYTFYDGIAAEEFLRSREQMNETVYSDYVTQTFMNTVSSLGEIDETISKHSVGWKVSRMSKTTKSILRLAVYEMTFTVTPPKAVINEAVILAKQYDDEKAAPFINGILNKIARSEGMIREEPSDNSKDE